MYSLAKEDMSDDETTATWLKKHVPDGTWVLQEYLMNPMTYEGHKFDLRVWAVITSLDPLRLHLLGSGIPKVSQWTYSKEASRVKEQCIHVLLPGTTECFYSKDPLVKIIEPYPHNTNGESWSSKMAPKGRKFWTEVAWPSLERVIVECLLLAREAIVHIDHRLKRRGLQYKRTYFLQPDVVFDASGQASLVEVNVNGYMIGNIHKDFFALNDEQRGVLRLIGANGYPLAPKYEKSLEAKIDSFCRESNCPPSAEAEIEEMVHEDMHASFGWYRIFPTGDDRPHTEHFKNTRQWARSLTPMDLLMFKWLRTGWEPRHVHDRNGTVRIERADAPRGRSKYYKN